MTLPARMWRNITISVALVVVLVFVESAYDVALYRTGILSGWLLLAFVLFLTLFGARRKIRVLPIGSNASWLQFHIYIGWLSLALFLIHTGFRVPNGWLEVTLALLFVLVAGSGVVGIALSRGFARRLTRHGEEVIFERIPIFLARIAAAAEDEVVQCTADSDSSTIADYHATQLAPFFSKPRNFFQHLLGSDRGLFSQLANLEHLDRYLNPREKVAASRLSLLVRKKEELDFHYALQATLKGWLFVHVPLTYGMLIFVAVHVVLVHAFSGGLG